MGASRKSHITVEDLKESLAPKVALPALEDRKQPKYKGTKGTAAATGA